MTKELNLCVGTGAAGVPLLSLAHVELRCVHGARNPLGMNCSWTVTSQEGFSALSTAEKKTFLNLELRL